MKRIQHGDTVNTAKIKESMKIHVPFLVESNRMELIFLLDFRRERCVRRG